jgi:hypothetical protein
MAARTEKVGEHDDRGGPSFYEIFDLTVEGRRRKLDEGAPHPVENPVGHFFDPADQGPDFFIRFLLATAVRDDEQRVHILSGLRIFSSAQDI